MEVPYVYHALATRDPGTVLELPFYELGGRCGLAAEGTNAEANQEPEHERRTQNVELRTTGVARNSYRRTRSSATDQ